MKKSLAFIILLASPSGCTQLLSLVVPAQATGLANTILSNANLLAKAEHSIAFGVL